MTKLVYIQNKGDIPSSAYLKNKYFNYFSFKNSLPVPF